MVYVFKSTAANSSEASVLIQRLQQLYPKARITVDLHDCDKVLRVEASEVDITLLAATAARVGVEIEELEE
ncbi:MAG: hypothetical protein QM781_19535 [Chitinophagaceae bacterium]